MAYNIETVGELRALLAPFADDQKLAVAATPDVTGWVNQLLYLVGTSQEDPELVVLGLAEETLGDEHSLGFVDPDTGEQQRPV